MQDIEREGEGRKVKKINIAVSALVSIGIGAISLWLFLSNGWKLIFYSQPLDLANLSEENIKTNRYVKGTISDCVTVPIEGRNDVRDGCSGVRIGVGKDYECYTIPIPEGRYIRVWLYEKESLKGMERILNGDSAEIPFAGLLVKSAMPLNTEWYGRNPKFEQDRVVTEFVLMQKTTDAEKNLFFVGLCGMATAALLFFSYGGIHIVEVPPEKKKEADILGYNKENEISIARKRLERYAEQERAYRKMSVIGTGCVIGGLFLVLAIPALALMGLVFMIYGVKKWWDRFINSENRHAMNIAKLFSLKTLQTKKAEEQHKIEEYEK